MRIGLFGGAFDPPHKAHVALAQAALTQLSLNVLHVLPTGDAWHKPRDLTPGFHRLAMCQQAFESFPNVVVDDLELKRPGPSYTVDTLRFCANATRALNFSWCWAWIKRLSSFIGIKVIKFWLGPNWPSPTDPWRVKKRRHLLNGTIERICT